MRGVRHPASRSGGAALPGAVCADDADIDLGIGSLNVPCRWPDLASADTIVVPAMARWDAPVPPGLIAALQNAHERGSRVVGPCTWAFALKRTDSTLSPGTAELARLATRMLAERDVGLQAVEQPAQG